jgi:hypothetical protein
MTDDSADPLRTPAEVAQLFQVDPKTVTRVGNHRSAPISANARSTPQIPGIRCPRVARRTHHHPEGFTGRR